MTRGRPSKAFALLLFALATLFFSAEARADDRCLGADVLEDLPQEDRAFLRRVCQLGDAAEAWKRGQPAELVRLKRILGLRLSRSDWEVTALLQLIPAGVFEPEAYAIRKCSEQEATKAITAALKGARTEQEEADPTQRRADAVVLPASCELASAADLGARESVDPGLVVLSVLAPKSMKVRVAVGGRTPRLIDLGLTQWDHLDPLTKKTSPEDLPFEVRFVKVPYNTPYAVWFEEENQADAGSEAIAGAPLPTVFRNVAFGPDVVSSHASIAGCVDIAVKSDDPLQFFLDGVPISVERQGRLYSAALWVPTDSNPREHRLSVVATKDGKTVVLASQSVEFDPKFYGRCSRAHLDLTTHEQGRTVGLLDVDAEACVDAGIDSPKVRAFISSFLDANGQRVADLRSFSSATSYFVDFRKALDALGGAPAGAERGRLDSVQNLSTGAEELLRQGFAELLVARLHCTKRAPSGWDYSFVAQTIDLKALGERSRDPITGISLDGVLHTEIDLITDRRNLGPQIESTLAQLFGVPQLSLDPPPVAEPYHWALPASIEVVPPADTRPAKYVVALTFRELRTSEVRNVCGLVSDIQELRAHRDYAPLNQLGDWRAGAAESVVPNGKRQRVDLTLEPRRPRNLILRASLNRKVGKQVDELAVSYQCINLSRPKNEVWGELVALYPSNSGEPARRESSSTYGAFFGYEQQEPMGNFSGGVGLGYTLTIREGTSPSTWDGLSERASFEQDGSADYRVFDHGVYVMLQGEVKGSLCEIGGGLWCNRFSRSVLLTARAALLPGLHVVDKNGIPPEFPEFRGETSTAFPDVGLLFGPGLAVQLASQTLFHARFLMGTTRIVDYTRSVADAGVYRQLLVGTSIGATWEFR